MAKVAALEQNELESGLRELDGWEVVDGKLHRQFEFADFIEAFAFMTKVALAAQSADHHPEWSNVYGSVTIDLITHAAGNAISRRDLELAKTINGFL